MQAKRKLLPILLVVMVAALLVAACGGGGGAAGQEKTIFNLPGVPLNVNADGAVNLYGLPISGVALPATLVQQLQAANVQELQMRVGAHGLEILANGQPLPMVNWDATSMANLQKLLAALGYGQLDLSGLRAIGSGVRLNVAPASGQPKLNIPRWSGPASFAATAPAEGAEPLNLDFVAIDPEGRITAAGLDLDALTPLLGGQALRVPPDLLNTLKSLGAKNIGLKTTPNSITVDLDGNPLPSLTFDQAALERMLALLGGMGLLPAEQLEMIQSQLGTLTSLNANIIVNLEGVPASATLPPLDVKVSESGSLNVLGIDVPGATLPAEILAQLADAGIQNVAIDARSDSLTLAVNGQTLPRITFSPEGLGVVSSLVSGLAGIPPELVTAGLNSLSGEGIKTTVALPGSTGEVALPTDPTFAPPDLGDLSAPTIAAKIAVQDGQIASVGGLSAEQLAALGVTLPALPANIMDILTQSGADQVDIVTVPNEIQIKLNGNQVMGIQNDAASLAAVWNLASPFLGDALAEPGLQKLIEEQLLPVIPGADVNLSIMLE